MIRILVQRGTEDSVRRIRVEGHSGYAEAGSDIVCAAVSVLCITLANGLRKYGDTPISARSSSADYELVFCETYRDGSVADSLVKTVLDGMSAIAQKYPGFVEIREEHLV